MGEAKKYLLTIKMLIIFQTPSWSSNPVTIVITIDTLLI
jgi:hypothetical protein